MPALEAAQRWKETWESAWGRKDADAIVALYARGCVYRSLAFRAPGHGHAWNEASGRVPPYDARNASG